MQSKATHPYHHFILRIARKTAGLFALALLVLFTSQDAFAQDARVLQEYRALEAAVEQARDGDTDLAKQRLHQFELANRNALEEALRMEALAGIQDTGGPDGFGYTYTDSSEPGGPAYSFISLTTTSSLAKTAAATVVADGDDNSSINSGIFGPVPLGGPGFNFYGVDYTSAVPATNGYISLGADAVLDLGPDLSNDCPIPSAFSTPGGANLARIYPLHDDLELDPGFGGALLWEYFPSCPHPHSSGGCNVFMWDNADHFNADGVDQFDFETILFNNGDIINQYGPGNTEAGSGSTTGIQDIASSATPPSTGLLYACNSVGSISGGLAVLFEFPDFSTADLAVTKTVNDAGPEVGDVVTFTITLDNVMGGAAVVRVNDLLPAGLAYVSSTTTQGTYNAGSGDWLVGTVGIAGTATLTINATVTTSNTVTNTAFVAFSSLPDPDVSNNRASASVNAVEADLELTKRVVDSRTIDGMIEAEFQVVIVNKGPEDVCGVGVTDTLSPDMELHAVSSSAGVVGIVGSVIDWGVGCLGVGSSATLNVRVWVPAGGNLINTAEVTASDLPDPDSVPGDGKGDDFALATAGARPGPDFVPEAGPGGIVSRGDRFTADLRTDKSVNVESAPVGGEVHYTVDVTNQGPQSTAKVEVTDHLPECLTDVTSTASRGSYDGWIWDIGKIKVGETVRLEVWATVGPTCTGTITNVAEVTASSLPDPDDLFNLFDEPRVQDEISEASFNVEAGANGRLSGTMYALGENYPNPFNPETMMPFSIPEAAYVSLKVYDLLGRTVATLVDGPMAAGVHEVRFEAGHLPTGMYLVRMEAAGKVFTQRITLMK